MFRYGLTIFLSAFLLFQVQPLFGKFILPWFGGTPATWTTCVLCFQVLLLAGYIYAHLTISRLTPRQQGTLHAGVLLAAILFLPIVPNQAWKPTGLESPAWRILVVLALTVGPPYLVLSTTTPLMQAWFARHGGNRSPYRLYALSNFGSLLGLLSYPFVVEPNLTLRVQAYVWSAMFLLFVALAAWCAWSVRAQPALPMSSGEAVDAAGESPRPFDRAMWLLLPMCGSVMLLATTNEMSQDVAAVPFLWVLPLSLYLLSFTITFDSPRWYWRGLWAVLLPVCAAGAFLAMNIGTSLELPVQVTVYSAALLASCMVLHGELARIKPGARHLTGYFLTISAGGALGALAVSLVAPLVLDGFYEFPVALMLSCVLLAVVLYRQANRGAPAMTTVSQVSVFVILLTAGIDVVRFFDADYLRAFNNASRNFFDTRIETITWGSDAVEHWLGELIERSWQVAGFAVIAILLPLMTRRPQRRYASHVAFAGAAIVAGVSGMIGANMVMAERETDTIASSRSFYGLLRVTKSLGKPELRTLQHGHITHGIQRVDDESRRWPTTYYSENSGVGIAIRGLRELERQGQGGLRVGVVGLGTGTLASYGMPGDYIRFYEINADVMTLNTAHFTFLKDSAATVEVSLGDARITMERERAGGKPLGFDVIAVDAFSGDAVPLHLLTREAFSDYFYHLKAGGVLAMHISNHYLDLGPLVHDLAEDAGRTAVVIENENDYTRTVYSSTWVLVTSNRQFLESDLVASQTTPWHDRRDRPKLLFTDDYANIFRILKRDEPADDAPQ